VDVVVLPVVLVVHDDGQGPGRRLQAVRVPLEVGGHEGDATVRGVMTPADIVDVVVAAARGQQHKRSDEGDGAAHGRRVGMAAALVPGRGDCTDG
jgi:hypothetical protein